MIVTGISLGYFIAHLNQIAKPDTTPYFKDWISWYLHDCSVYNFPTARAPLKLYFSCVSQTFFNNTRMIPLIFSTALIGTTYILAKKISKNEIISIVSVLLLCISSIFEFYVNFVAFEQSWTVLFLLSFILIYQKPILTGITFTLSLFLKGLPLFFIPFVFYIIRHADSKKKKLAYLSMTASLLFATIYTMIGSQQILQTPSLQFSSSGLSVGITSLYFVFRHDHIQFGLFAFSIFNFLMLWRQGDKTSKSLLFFIIAYYASVVILPVFTMYMQYDYRMMPMIVIDCIGTALVLKNPQIMGFVLESIPLTISKGIEVLQFKIKG